LQQLRKQVVHFKEDAYRAKLSEIKKIEKERDQLSHTISQIETKLGTVTNWIDHRDPEVMGIIGSLFHSKNPEFNTVLEIAAGSKLFNIVTATDNKAADVIKHSKKRISVAPLNRMSYKPISSEAVQMASKQGAKVALDYIEYDASVPGLTNAMGHVFGNTFVAKNIDVAEKVENALSLWTVRCLNRQEL